jgi:hypothetical protein
VTGGDAGKTAMALAVENDQAEVVKFLESAGPPAGA